VSNLDVGNMAINLSDEDDIAGYGVEQGIYCYECKEDGKVEFIAR